MGNLGMGTVTAGGPSAVTAPESIDMDDHPGADDLDPALREAIEALELSV